MKRFVLLFIVITLIFLFTKIIAPPKGITAAPLKEKITLTPKEKVAMPPKEDNCGVERWKVKTLSDVDSFSIDFTHIVPSTVSYQARMQNIKIRADVRQPSENTIYRITALLTSYKSEDDGDIHIVLQDPLTCETMIAEIPNPKCTNIQQTSRSGAVTIVRDWFIEHIGRPSSKFKNTKIMITITGTSFIDHIHGQRGAAPNGREIHPVLSMQYPDAPVTLGRR